MNSSVSRMKLSTRGTDCAHDDSVSVRLRFRGPKDRVESANQYNQSRARSSYRQMEKGPLAPSIDYDSK